MKITENLKNVMKGFEGIKTISVNDLAKKLGKTPNSIRATLSVPNYKPYFVKDRDETIKDKTVYIYSLSELGQELVNNNFKLQEEENN